MKAPVHVDSLGLAELASIAAGCELADGMVKAAQVELVQAAPLCSGRFLVLVAGDRGAVGASVAFAKSSGLRLQEACVISGVSPRVMDCLRHGPAAPSEGRAVGVVESRLVAPGIRAADAAAKRADVEILRFVAGHSIAGKSYFVLEGDVAAVRESVEAAKAELGARLVEAVVIPRPDRAVALALAGRHL